MIYISIGSNLGNRLANIQDALALLKSRDFKIIKQSPVIETRALLPENAPAAWDQPFFNMVISGTIDQPIIIFLEQLQEIERILGREMVRPKWSPRMMDLDILFVDEEIICEKNLSVPHSELLHRPFLCHLLAMIAPDLKHPENQKNMSALAYESSNKIEDCFTRSLVATPKLVGIVNVTPDSFSDGGHFLNPEKAIERILQLYEDGASVIEIGAQSTRPSATIHSAAEEYQRLEAVFEGMKNIIHEKKLRISLDSFFSETILKLIKKYPISWVNDVKGDLDEDCLKQIVEQGCQFVAMHSITVPPNQENIISLERRSIETILVWAEKKLEKLERLGFKKENLILDPGIGFGKTPYQNLSLLQDIAQLKSLGCSVLVGHARKSFMNLFRHGPAYERDIETLAISDYLADLGVDYLRVYSVAEHQRFMVAKSFGYVHV